MVGLLGKIKAFLHFTKADSLINSGSLKEAVSEMHHVYDAFNVELYSSDMIPLFSLRFAFLLLKCELYDESNRACHSAIEYLKMDKHRRRKRYKENDNLYLNLYANYILIYNNYGSDEDLVRLTADFSAINLARVNSEIKLMLPLNFDFLSGRRAIGS